MTSKDKDLYIRRLIHLGFTGPMAENLHMYELMTLKHDSVEPLCDPGYIYGRYFDLKQVMFPESADYYAEHQMFLVSELTKIWDEAEYICNNVPRSTLPEEVLKEICSISLYGGGELLIKGLMEAAASTATPMELIRSYSRAEQDLLYRYKWYPDTGIEPPYGEQDRN